MKLCWLFIVFMALFCSSAVAVPLGTEDAPIIDENGKKWWIQGVGITRYGAGGVQSWSTQAGPGYWSEEEVAFRYNPSALRCTVAGTSSGGEKSTVEFSWNGDLLNPVALVAGDQTLSRDNSSVIVTHGNVLAFSIQWKLNGEVSGAASADSWFVTVHYASSDWSAVATTQPEVPDDPTTQPPDEILGVGMNVDLRSPGFEEFLPDPPDGSANDYPADTELPWVTFEDGPAAPADWRLKWSEIIPRMDGFLTPLRVIFQAIVTICCAWWVLEELKRT